MRPSYLYNGKSYISKIVLILKWDPVTQYPVSISSLWVCSYAALTTIIIHTGISYYTASGEICYIWFHCGHQPQAAAAMLTQ